jgi:hypothetical protein
MAQILANSMLQPVNFRIATMAANPDPRRTFSESGLKAAKEGM